MKHAFNQMISLGTALQRAVISREFGQECIKMDKLPSNAFFLMNYKRRVLHMIEM
jgi:hypothetical protein